jgi:hypothetical protein
VSGDLANSIGMSRHGVSSASSFGSRAHGVMAF